MRRTKSGAQRTEGAVMVEALIAGTVLAICLGALVFLHRYAAGHLVAFQSARGRAWQQAMTECNQPEPLFEDLASDLIHGEIPFPDNMIPTAVDGQSSYELPGLLGLPTSGSTSVTFICNPRPSQADPLAEPNEWVFGLFM